MATVPNPGATGGGQDILARIDAERTKQLGSPIVGAEFTAARANTPAATGGLRIPVWRKFKKAKGPYSVVGPNGLTASERGRYRSMDDDTFDADGASQQFGVLLSDKQKLREWQDIALKAGLVSPDNVHDANALGAAWDKAVGWAMRISAASGGRTELTPFEAARMVSENTGSAMLAQQTFAAERARLAEETFSGTKTFTQSQTDLRASNAPESVLRDLLGRKPTKGEMAAYSQGVQAVAKRNPVTQTGESTFENGQKISEQVTLSGGFDAEAAQTQAASSATPEVAMMQNASTHYNALLQAIQAAV